MGPFECEPMDTFRRVFNTNVLGHMEIVHTLMKACFYITIFKFYRSYSYSKSVLPLFIQRIREDKARIVIMGAPDFPIAQYCYKTICNSALLGFTRGPRYHYKSVFDN